MAKLTFMKFAELWGELSRLDTKYLERIGYLIADELSNRALARKKGPNLDDLLAPRVGQPPDDADAT